jgi:hypothetical protein
VTKKTTNKHNHECGQREKKRNINIKIYKYRVTEKRRNLSDSPLTQVQTKREERKEGHM